MEKSTFSRLLIRNIRYSHLLNSVMNYVYILYELSNCMNGELCSVLLKSKLPL